MPSARELLRRFRPAGAPGPGAAAGVPADRREEIRRELLAVLEQLDSVSVECEAIRGHARRDAAARVADAARSAELIRAKAAADAERVGAATVATARRQADETAERALQSAKQQAEQVAKTSGDQTDVLAGDLAEAILTSALPPAGALR